MTTILARATGELELPFVEVGKTVGGAGLWGTYQEFSFGHVQFENLRKHLSGHVELIVVSMLEFRRNVWAGDYLESHPIK